MGKSKPAFSFKILFCKILAVIFYIKLSLQLLIRKKLIVLSEIKTIVHINATDIVGGAAKIASDLLAYQNKNGLTSSMLVGTKRSNSLSIHEIPLNNTKLQDFVRTGHKKLQWQDFFHLSSLDLKNNPIIKNADIVHLHNIHGDYFSPFAVNELSKIKTVVWTLHDMQSFTGHCAHSYDCTKWQTGCGNCPSLTTYPWIDFDTSAFIWKTKKMIFQKSNFVIVTPSNWLKEKVEKSMLNHLPVFTIHNGIDTSIFRPQNKQDCRQKLDIPADKTVVLFSAERGLRNHFKGGAYIQNIMQNKDDDSLLFINIGGGNEVVKTETLWTIPYIKDATIIAEYYASADIYLYPSLADNCPLVVLEAMACGLPIVTFQTGGIPELVEHLQTGYIAQYKDSADFQQGFSVLLHDNDLRMQMSKNALARVSENFTMEIMNRKYVDLYTSFLNK